MTIPDRDVTQIAADEPEARVIEETDREGLDEQRPADPTQEPEEVHRGPEVDEFDAMEQARVVAEEEDYDR